MFEENASFHWTSAKSTNFFSNNFVVKNNSGYIFEWLNSTDALTITDSHHFFSVILEEPKLIIRVYVPV